MTKQECYENLANAIIIQAVKDYRAAVQKENSWAKRNIEKFFKSEYFSGLTDISGEMLLKKLKELK